MGSSFSNSYDPYWDGYGYGYDPLYGYGSESWWRANRDYYRRRWSSDYPLYSSVNDYYSLYPSSYYAYQQPAWYYGQFQKSYSPYYNTYSPYQQQPFVYNGYPRMF